MDYLEQQNLSALTGFKIKELVEENLGISISQPTASKIKGEILENIADDWGPLEDESSFKRPTEETDAMAESTKRGKIRQLSMEQMNALEYLLQGQSDKSVADTVGVSRQVIWEWRNHDPLFIAELNRQRIELWKEARERLKSLANHALDVLEQQLNSGDPKAALAASKYILQGTRLLGETELHVDGPTTPEGVLLPGLRVEAREELAPKIVKRKSFADDLLFFGNKGNEEEIEKEIEALAQSKLKKALAEAGIS